MKYLIGIFYIAAGLFLAYTAVNQYLENHDIYKIILSYTTEDRNVFLAFRGGISALIIVFGILRIKKANNSKS